MFRPKNRAGYALPFYGLLSLDAFLLPHLMTENVRFPNKTFQICVIARPPCGRGNLSAKGMASRSEARQHAENGTRFLATVTKGRGAPTRERLVSQTLLMVYYSILWHNREFWNILVIIIFQTAPDGRAFRDADFKEALIQSQERSARDFVPN